MGILDGLDRKLRACKIGLFILNFICLLLGLAVVGAAIYFYVDKSDLLSYTYQMNVARPACILILAAGAATAFISLLGCISASTQSKVFILIYIIILIFVTMTAIVGTLLAISGKAQWTDFIRQQMRQSLQTQYGVNVTTNSYNAFITNMWDDTQQKWYCCAVENSSWGVYKSSLWYDQQPGSKEYDRPMVPPSCCTRDQYGNIINLQKCQIWAWGPPNLQSSALPNEALFYKGCYDYGTTLLQRVSGGLIAMGIIMIIVLACCLLLSIAMLIFLRREKPRTSVIKQQAYVVSKQNPSYSNVPTGNGY